MSVRSRLYSGKEKERERKRTRMRTRMRKESGGTERRLSRIFIIQSWTWVPTTFPTFLLPVFGFTSVDFLLIWSRTLGPLVLWFVCFRRMRPTKMFFPRFHVYLLIMTFVSVKIKNSLSSNPWTESTDFVDFTTSFIYKLCVCKIFEWNSTVFLPPYCLLYVWLVGP